MKLGIRQLAVLAFAACIAVAGLSLPAGAPAAAPAAQAADIDHQVLVMLKLPPPHLRPGVGYEGGYQQAARGGGGRISKRLARAYGLEVVSDWPMPLIGIHCFVLRTPAGLTPQDAAERLSRDPAVEWAQPVNLYVGQDAGARADPLFLTQPAAREWRLAELHEVATGRGVKVAVIDSLIDAHHPDLAGQVQVSKDFAPVAASAPEQHGTRVAGVIAAKANNGLGIAGIAPQARLLALRACWQRTPNGATAVDTVCDTLSLAKALDFAINHDAQVINLSLAGPPDRLLAKLIDVAGNRDITVVAAFHPSMPGGGFPASHAGVIAVVDGDHSPIPAGVYGAPGRDVPTTLPGGRWSLVTGSSFAAAHVSGLVALLREHEDPPRQPILVSDHGVIDACATLRRSKETADAPAPRRRAAPRSRGLRAQINLACASRH